MTELNETDTSAQENEARIEQAREVVSTLRKLYETHRDTSDFAPKDQSLVGSSTVNGHEVPVTLETHKWKDELSVSLTVMGHSEDNFDVYDFVMHRRPIGGQTEIVRFVDNPQVDSDGGPHFIFTSHRDGDAIEEWNLNLETSLQTFNELAENFVPKK